MNQQETDAEATPLADTPQASSVDDEGPAGQLPDAGGLVESVSRADQTSDSAAALDGAPSVQRLHPATVWLPLCQTVLGAVVPAVVVGAFIGYRKVAIYGFLFVILPTAIYYVLRFATVRFRLEGSELIIKSGWIWRRERQISFDRIQDTDIDQGLVYRALDLAKLEITTAGSEAQEAVLDTLSRPAAESLRNAIATYQKLPVADEGANANDQTNEHDSELLCQLSLADLVLGGLTSNLVASVFAVIGTILYFKSFLTFGIDPFKHFELGIAERARQQLPEQGLFGGIADFFFEDTFGKSLFFALAGFLISIASYVMRYHGFRLTRLGSVLSKAYGLFTFRTSSLAQGRIQALKIEEGLLRRWFNLAAIRVDSAGDRSEVDDRKKRDALVPVATKTTVYWLTLQVIPGLRNPEPQWKRISRLAVLRGSKKGWLLMLLVMLQTFLMFRWFCLVWLPAIPLVYVLNYQWYRNTGYWLEEQYLISRKGWLNRETLFLPIKNIQNVQVTQSYFDRRLNLATLCVDTAGQSNTGGGPKIRNLPVDEARCLQQMLSKRTAESEFTW